MKTTFGVLRLRATGSLLIWHIKSPIHHGWYLGSLAYESMAANETLRSVR